MLVISIEHFLLVTPQGKIDCTSHRIALNGSIKYRLNSRQDSLEYRFEYKPLAVKLYFVEHAAPSRSTRILLQVSDDSQ